MAEILLREEGLHLPLFCIQFEIPKSIFMMNFFFNLNRKKMHKKVHSFPYQ